MKISLTLVHNKTDAENEAQVEVLKSLLDLTEEKHDLLDDKGNLIGQFTKYNQSFKDINIPHEVKVFQIIPFGTTPPPSRYTINSGGIVQFGSGDEDKTGNHPRFFNWGAKRGVDNGGEVSVYIEDVNKLDINNLAIQLNSLVDPNDKHEYAEDESVKVVSSKLFIQTKGINEKKSRAESIKDFKLLNTRLGGKNG